MLQRQRSNITLSIRDSGLCSFKVKTPLKGRGFLYKIDENDRFNVANYDMVVFNFEHISHSDYFILRNKIDGAAKNGVVIPVGYIRATNIRQAGEAICRLLLRKKDGQDTDRI